MDYPNRARMKILGRVSVIPENDWETLAQLEVADYRAQVERGFKIHIEGFDWNCPQHITPRFTEQYVNQLLEPLQQENHRLKRQISAFGSSPTKQPFSNGNGDDANSYGEGELELVVSGIRQLAPKVRAFELRDIRGGALPKVKAGSHIQLPVKLANGETTKRHYSICSNPARRDIYEVAILREDEGSGGSVAIHESYQLGQIIFCSKPENHFQLDDSAAPKVLIAGGIGITPIKAMAQELKAKGHKFELHYAGKNIQAMPFRDRLAREFGESIHIYSSADNQRLDIASLLKTISKDAQIYLCGPNRLIEAVKKEAKAQNIDLNRIRFEAFSAVVDPQAKPVELILKRSEKTIQVKKDQSLLDAMLDQGVSIPFSCKTGVCRSCAVKVIDGSAQHKDSVLTKEEKDVDKMMCPCVSRATTDSLTLDI